MGTARSFGEYVTVARQQRGYSIRQLANQVDVAPSTIMRIEGGTHTLSHPDLFLALVDVLELDIIAAVKLVEPYHRLYKRITAAPEGRQNE